MNQRLNEAKHKYLGKKTHKQNNYSLCTDTDKLNESLNKYSKIFKDINQTKSKIIEIESEFQIRQKQYQDAKLKKLQQLKQDQIESQKILSSGKPKINKTNESQQMINKYIEYSKQSKFGDLLQKQNKNIQTKETQKLNKLSTFILDNIGNYENDDPDGIGVQTLQSTKIVTESQQQSKIQDQYIPIHERVQFLIQTRQNKIQEKQQQKNQLEEEFYQSLTFQPLSVKSQNCKFTPEITQQFISNQSQWIDKKNKWVLDQQLKKLCETPRYSYRPSISPWPKKPKSAKREHSTSFNISFVHTSARKTEASPKRNTKSSLIFHTDLRIAKRKEKELQQQQQFLKYN